MELAELCLGSIAGHVRALGIECDDPSGQIMSVPGMAMDFLTHDLESKRSFDGFSVAVTFEARAEGLIAEAVKVFALGMGPSAEAAAVDAGHQWSVGVLPVIASHLLNDREIPRVEKARMIVQDGETGKQFGWTVHLGEVIGRAFGPPGSMANLRDLSRLSAYRPIFDAVLSIACHHQLMWVESFVNRYPGSKVDATCRFRNEDWPEGKESLMAWAATWPDTRGHLISKRQFLVFEPTPVDRLSTGLRTQLENAKKLPWWKRGLSGR